VDFTDLGVISHSDIHAVFIRYHRSPRPWVGDMLVALCCTKVFSTDNTSPPVSDTARVAQPLTHLFEKFREQFGHVTATGDTAVYDALNVARSQLAQYRTDLPHLRRRIIIVSDGEDTSSKQSVLGVLAGLQRDRITVDSVQVGPIVDPALHGISVVTGIVHCPPQLVLSNVFFDRRIPILPSHVTQ
jgi:hypothetical protein